MENKRNKANWIIVYLPYIYRLIRLLAKTLPPRKFKCSPQSSECVLSMLLCVVNSMPAPLRLISTNRLTCLVFISSSSESPLCQILETATCQTFRLVDIARSISFIAVSSGGSFFNLLVPHRIITQVGLMLIVGSR